jgi:membrane protein YqaA with SNARE-associated domain
VTLSQVNEEVRKRWWQRYFIIGVGILLTGLVVVAFVYFWDKIQDAAGYGYAGCFVVAFMAGTTILPAPALPVVFTLGHKLSPLYIGLVAGLGEALGGITTYLTGAGGGTIWSKLRAKPPAAYNQTGMDAIPLVTRRLQSRQRAFFDRIVAPMRRWGGFWPVFIASAVVFSPFYFVGLGAGALGMGLKRFFLISWAGKTVKGLYIAFAGQWGLYFLLQWLGG